MTASINIYCKPSPILTNGGQYWVPISDNPNALEDELGNFITDEDGNFLQREDTLTPTTTPPGYTATGTTVTGTGHGNTISVTPSTNTPSVNETLNLTVTKLNGFNGALVLFWGPDLWQTRIIDFQRVTNTNAYTFTVPAPNRTPSSDNCFTIEYVEDGTHDTIVVTTDTINTII